MMHHNRNWTLTTVPSSQKLAEMLTQQTWCGCSGFAVRGHDDYLFLNDATSGDGAQEYGVLKRHSDGLLTQFESITFSWCSPTKAEALIDECLSGRFDPHFDFGTIAPRQIETPAQHRRQFCPLCA